MASRMDDVMHLCCEISAHDNIRVAVKKSTKGLGGLLSGPPEHVVSGAFGGLFGPYLSMSEFRPLPQILMELLPNQQQMLFNHITAVLGNLDWTDAAQLIALVMGNTILQKQVTAALLGYITKEYRAEVRYQD